MRSRWITYALMAVMSGCSGLSVPPDAAVTGAPDAPEVFDAGQTAQSATPSLDTGLLPSGRACERAAQCRSGSCLRQICSDWAHALRISFNNPAATSEANPPVLNDFPALVRLSKENFPFLAATRGSDIRFVDQDGNDLAYEIEDWNTASRLAAIWVHLPRLAPGSERDFIIMYWGNSTAVSLSSGPAVFSSYSTVLHLTPGSDRRPLDSSGHGNDAVTIGSWSGAWTSGQAGQALDINDLETLRSGGPMPAPAEFTLSIWFKTTAKRGGGLIGFADTPSDKSNIKDRLLWMADRRMHFAVLDQDGTYKVVSSPSLGEFDVGYTDGRWHVAVARLSPEGQHLFVDGDMVAGIDYPPRPVSYDGFWRFGTSEVGYWPIGSKIPSATSDQFPGVIDEIRISSHALSDQRIAAEYQIQREDTRWVKTDNLDLP